MNILRIIYEWPPPWEGLAPSPYEISKAQVKRGHTISVFCGRWPRAGKLEEVPNVTLYPFIREPLSGTLLITVSPFVLIYYLIWRKTHRPDVIHSHGHFAIWIYLYRKLLKKYKPDSEELKIPLVVQFHNTVKGRWVAAEENDVELKVQTKFIHWPLALLSDKWAVEVASACIFVSTENMQDALKHYDADPNKCFVVENGVNTADFSPIGGEEKEKTRKELDFDQYDKVILNLGYIVERKNIHLLVEALELLPQAYKLLLVGTGDESYIDRINGIIQEKKLQGRVTRVGYTAHPDVHVAYQAADIFVLPSTFEGLPKVILESLAAGVPVLGSGFKLNDHIQGLYYLESLEPKTIAERIKQIIENPQFVDFHRVREVYSWDVKVLDIDKVYEKITGTHV